MTTLRGLIGYSPELLEHELKTAGGSPLRLGVAVATARQGTRGAPKRLQELTPEDRAALDRYATFAQMSAEESNPLLRAAKYAGGMGAMALTEAVKAAPAAQRALTAIQSRFLGSAAEPFGGRDTSRPNLGNLLAAHYGFMRSR